MAPNALNFSPSQAEWSLIGELHSQHTEHPYGGTAIDVYGYRTEESSDYDDEDDVAIYAPFKWQPGGDIWGNDYSNDDAWLKHDWNEVSGNDLIDYSPIGDKTKEVSKQYSSTLGTSGGSLSMSYSYTIDDYLARYDQSSDINDDYAQWHWSHQTYGNEWRIVNQHTGSFAQLYRDTYPDYAILELESYGGFNKNIGSGIQYDYSQVDHTYNLLANKI